MTDTMRQAWEEIAKSWDDWGPPLRPCPEDIAITRRILRRWRSESSATPPEATRAQAWHRASARCLESATPPPPPPPEATPPGAAAKVAVFLCGVTPEIATMDWPFPIDLVGMDRAESMVRHVWPGDVPGVRRATVGNWLEPGVERGSRGVVIGDGGFGFSVHPDGQRVLARVLHGLLQPDGLFLYRHYAQAARQESVGQVVDAMRAGRIGNFHIFKWRMAMALQPDSRTGVRLGDIWQAVQEAGIDPARLPQPGWSPRIVDTLRFYRGKDSRLYFADLEEFRAMLAEVFRDIEVVYPEYELGERCPILAARPR